LETLRRCNPAARSSGSSVISEEGLDKKTTDSNRGPSCLKP
jgi:hypothetical protein